MARSDPALDRRRWSAPVETPGDSEPRATDDALSAEPRPAISIGEALQNDWLEIWYQPKIDLKRRCLAGAEAHLRIHHPQHGLMWPESIVPGVDGGDIARLTEQALIATLRSWPKFEAAGFSLQLAINVPVSVMVRMPLADLLREHGPKSERWPGLILEVTEDEIVRDAKSAREIANELRAIGVTISIDDFGAGYSSFASLRALPFSEIKLAGSFVKNCAADATNAAICQTAIDLAHRFGSAAVAEGIESADDMQSLMIMGCDLGQGVLIAPPMPQQHFLDLLRRRASGARPPAQADAASGGVSSAAGSVGPVA